MPIVIVALFIIAILFGLFVYAWVRVICSWWAKRRAERVKELRKKINLGVM